MPTAPKSALELLGLPPAPRTGRERLIAAAVELFYRNGFSAVGIDRIIEQAGVTKTTFYKHFESRDDLMVAAVQRRDEWESQAWARAIRKIAGDDPVRSFLAMLDVLEVWFNDPDYVGCMFLSAGFEFPNPNDPVHKAAAAYKKRGRDQWRELAVRAGAEAAAADAFADCYVALIEGALVLRHTQGRDDAARIIRPAVEQLIRAYIPSEKPPTRRGLARAK